MPRFVLLRHECPPAFGKPSHWDLMLEDGDSLLTWSIAELPVAGGNPVDAERLSDHRLAYLDFEGPLSGNRGEVQQVDAGEFRWLQREPAPTRIELSGQTLRGILHIEQLGGKGTCQLTLDP